MDPGDKTTGRPGDKVDISTRWTPDRIMCSATGQYVTSYYAADKRRQPIPDYFIWDFKLSLEIISGLRIFLVVDNIFDDAYAIYANLPGSEAGLYTMPRRRFTTGLDIHL